MTSFNQLMYLFKNEKAYDKIEQDKLVKEEIQMHDKYISSEESYQEYLDRLDNEILLRSRDRKIEEANQKIELANNEIDNMLDKAKENIIKYIEMRFHDNLRDFMNTLSKQQTCKRIFKVHHDDNEVEKELSLIVDLGGFIEDVFVYQKVYNIVRATLNIASRRDIKNYMENLQNGHSSLLKNVTSGYHYHTVHADSEEILDEIQDHLYSFTSVDKLKSTIKKHQ